VTAELERVAAKKPLAGIDTARYEAQQEEDEEVVGGDREKLASTLSRAYATATYLTGRQTHLQLLDSFGRNAWLVSNWQAEAELAALERELVATRKEMDLVNIERRRAQDEVGEELRGLNETWRNGVGRVLETEVACEALRRQVDERRRQGDA
jgi:pre-mRNA-splicing factor SPF27